MIGLGADFVEESVLTMSLGPAVTKSDGSILEKKDGEDDASSIWVVSVSGRDSESWAERKLREIKNNAVKAKNLLMTSMR